MFTHLLDKNGKPSSRKLTRPNALDVLIQHTCWMKEDAPPAERLYCAINNIVEYKKLCKVCSHPVKFGAWGRAYKENFCSIQCQGKGRKKRPKREKIILPLMSEEEKQRRREKTSMERYGVPNYLMSDEYKKEREKKVAENRKVRGAKWIETLNTSETLEPQFTPDEYSGRHEFLPIKCTKCKSIFTLSLSKFPTCDRSACPTCFTPNASKGQHSISEWIKSLGILVKINDRKEFAGKHEIDLYIQSHNLAIEYDGLYWHSERGRPDIKEKCKEKRDKILVRGIRLIEVFEDDWELKQEIVKSRIKNALGMIDRKIGARKTEVVKLSNFEYKTFMEMSHLQGYTHASFRIGLIYNGELVAAMSFSRARFNKNIDWELLRFATLPGTSVVGGASKLFNYWRNHHVGQSIVSFSDNRWGNGSFYEKLGFRNDGVTPQGYFYINSGGKRRSRQQMMKHNLAEQFENFDPALSERDNCWNNKWYRVWDQGNTRWILDCNASKVVNQNYGSALCGAVAD